MYRRSCFFRLCYFIFPSFHHYVYISTITIIDNIKFRFWGNENDIGGYTTVYVGVQVNSIDRDKYCSFFITPLKLLSCPTVQYFLSYYASPAEWGRLCPRRRARDSILFSGCSAGYFLYRSNRIILYRGITRSSYSAGDRRSLFFISFCTVAGKRLIRRVSFTISL